MGTARLGTHMYYHHPQHFEPKRKESVKKLAAKVLQSHAVAKEINRLAERGVRFLPKNAMGKVEVQMVQAWLQRMKGSDDVKQRMLLGGMERAERGIHSQQEFLRLQKNIKALAELDDRDLPGLYQHSTYFTPGVAGEILKLAFALNKSWSFSVHLLLLYGLDALAEQIAKAGPHPPEFLSKPAKAIAANQAEERRQDLLPGYQKDFNERNPNFDPDKRVAPYVEKVTYERPEEMDED